MEAQAGVEAAIRFEPEGVRCTLCVPQSRTEVEGALLPCSSGSGRSVRLKDTASRPRRAPLPWTVVQVARGLDAVLPAVPPQRCDGLEANGVAVKTRRPTHKVEQATRVVLHQDIPNVIAADASEGQALGHRNRWKTT